MSTETKLEMPATEQPSFIGADQWANRIYGPNALSPVACWDEDLGGGIVANVYQYSDDSLICVTDEHAAVYESKAEFDSGAPAVWTLDL